MTTIPRGTVHLWGESDPTRLLSGLAGGWDILNGAPQVRYQARLILTFVQNATVGSGAQIRQDTIWTTGFLLVQTFPFRDVRSGNRVRAYIIPEVDITLQGPIGWLYQ